MSLANFTSAKMWVMGAELMGLKRKVRNPACWRSANLRVKARSSLQLWNAFRAWAITAALNAEKALGGFSFGHRAEYRPGNLEGRGLLQRVFA